ncbi:MAG: sensor histidine kinase, partial [Ginsengibacter sp.]
MKFNIHKLSVLRLQWLIWACVLLMVFFTTLAEDPLGQAVVYTLLNTGFYAAIIYGNISFLYPRFYEKGRETAYFIYAAIYIITLALSRGFVAMFIYNHYFATQPEKFTASQIFALIGGATLDFIISLIFRIALAYFKLKQQSEEIRLQKTKAELQLLKSQVQPHFLFNTLNNIYYEAYIEAPKTAELIEKLSEIMHYLVDESSREFVLLSSEIDFLENYISLERIRIRYGVSLTFEKNLDHDVSIPPMLMMPLVENIFKHGIDKGSEKNEIVISLSLLNNYITFQT